MGWSDVGDVDAIVVGAGFGGLGAALGLAERGARVALFETLDHPGGCASTFTRRGTRYEAGATMVAGLGEGQVLRSVAAKHGIPLVLRPLDPVLEVRWGDGGGLVVPPSRAGLVDALCRQPGAPVDALRAAFAAQGRASDALWALFDDPALLPPWTAASLARLVARAPSLVPLVRWVGRPLSAWLAAHGLLGFEPARRWFESICRITVQAGVDEAETPYALAAADFLFRGVRHLDGGIGTLASGVCGAIEALGGRVHLACRVRKLTPVGGAWVAETRHGTFRAPVVVANVAPQALGALAGVESPRVARLGARVETGWGAVMLYRRLPPGSGPHHLDLVRDPGAPFLDGNHALVSVSEPHADGARTLTASTHVRWDALAGRERIERVQAELRRTLAALAPELEPHTDELTASPRTFQRFTGRPGGWVGGVPRRFGLGAYRELLPRPVAPGLWLVGDALQMGQSTLATFVSGDRVAAAVAPGITAGGS